MTTFDRYLLKQYLFTFIALFTTIFGLFIVIDGFSNVDAYQEGAKGSLEVFQRMAIYYMYQSIIFVDLIGSIVAVISAIVVFAILYKNHEIHPLLAAGVPTYRLIAPILIGTLLITAGVIANQEILIPRYAHFLMQPRGAKQADNRKVEPSYDRKSRILITGKGMSVKRHLMHSPSFVLPAPGVVTELLTLNAKEAKFYPATKKHPAGWLLSNVATPYKEIKFSPGGKKYILPGKTERDLFVVSNVTFDQVFDRRSNSQRTSIPVLVHRIRHPSTSHSTVGAQTLLLHSRLLQPLKNIAIIFIALPLVIRRESRSLVTNLAICVGVMGLIFGIVQVFAWLGKTNIIATDLAAWAPIILSATFAAWLTSYVQT